MKIIFFKTVLIACVISFFANDLFAQKAYVTVNGQYGFSTKNSFHNINSTKTGTTTTFENAKGSLGKGLNAGAAFGYMFTNNIGAELGVSYLSGSEYDSSPQNNTKYTYSSNMLQINPSFIISAGLKKINPYAKVGLLIGSGSILYDQNTNLNGDIYVYNTKYNGGLAWGLNAGVGVLYSLSDKMSLFSQLTMTDMTYAPTKGEVIEWTVKGVDQLPTAKVSDTQFEYSDSYTSDSNNPSPNSQPTKDLKTYYPFNNLGFSLGLKYGF